MWMISKKTAKTLNLELFDWKGIDIFFEDRSYLVLGLFSFENLLLNIAVCLISNFSEHLILAVLLIMFCWDACNLYVVN